jgi:protein-disulfide isomerase
MHAVKPFLVLLAVSAAACGQPKSKSKAEPVATIGDETITSDDLNKEIGPQLEQMEDQYHQQVYQLKRQTLDKLVSEKLFNAEAKKAGKANAEEFIRGKVEEIVNKVPEPTDEELQKAYDTFKQSGQPLPAFEEAKPTLARILRQQTAQPQLVAYYEGLKKERGVKLMLAPYLPPKKDVEAKGPSKGEKGAPITIVEFSDYQCPFCVRAEPTVTELLKAYPGKILLVYRDFPLPIHPLAPKAAEASHCAEDQGKYWEMHDGALEVDNLKKLAREVGLKGEDFDKCLDSGQKKALVDEHTNAGKALGVTGTPAFFINGHLLSGALPLDEFKAIIDSELKK